MKSKYKTVIHVPVSFSISKLKDLPFTPSTVKYIKIVTYNTKRPSAINKWLNKSVQNQQLWKGL